MNPKKIEVKKIEESIQGEWITAKELKDKLNLRMSTQKFGRILAEMTKGNAKIETGMKGHVLAYRKTPEAIIEEKKAPALSQETMIETKAEPKDLETKILNIVNDMISEGPGVAEICYNILKDSKEKYEKEITFVKDNASMFYTEFENMKDRIRKLKNQIQDYKDRIRQLEMKDVVKSVSEERNQRSDLIA